MSTTPGYAESLASGVVDIYNSVELQMLGIVSHGVTTSRTDGLRQVQVNAEAALRKALPQVQAEVAGSISEAVNYGSRSAVAELGSTLAKGLRGTVPTSSVAALAAEASGNIEAAHFQILPRTVDIYRRVTAEVINSPLLGVETPKQAAMRALKRYAQEGVTVFSRGGRTWQISSYVEMSLRTSLMNATLQGHTDKLLANGNDLVLVSDHTQECRQCRPFEGKILSLSGNSQGTVEIQRKDGSFISVHVMTTLKEAKNRGLFHPNCRHSFTAYLPGISRSFGETSDPQGDADRQRLRYLERKVREQRRIAEATDPSPEATAAKRTARDLQARIRAHVANTSAVRQPDRERITGAFR